MDSAFDLNEVPILDDEDFNEFNAYDNRAQFSMNDAFGDNEGQQNRTGQDNNNPNTHQPESQEEPLHHGPQKQPRLSTQLRMQVLTALLTRYNERNCNKI